MRNALAGLAGLMLQGCGALLVQESWLDAPTHAALRPFHIELSEEELPRACGNAPALKLYGCAVRVQQDRVCIIYTTPKPAGWVMDHERLHCAGWDHK